MTDELIARLRDAKRDWPEFSHDRAEAADRIEALTAEYDEAMECNEQFFVDNEFLKKRVAKAEAERDQLRLYARHDDDCTVNRYPSAGACSCGLRAAHD